MIFSENLKKYFEQNEAEFIRLVKEGQTPKTLFIGCSDSRVIPEMLTSSKPGDLFVVRNIGNMVPEQQVHAGYLGVTSAIEYAVNILNVEEIIVCGHSHCGAIRALYEPPVGTTENIKKWLELAEEAKIESPTLTEDVLRTTEQNSIKIQLSRLIKFDCVAKKLQEGSLKLHGWHFYIENGQIEVYNANEDKFENYNF